MSKIKCLIAVLLCAVLLCGATPLGGLSWLDLSALFTTKAAAEEPTSGFCGSNLTWNYDSQTKTLTIAGTGVMYDFEDNPWPSSAPWHSLNETIETVDIGLGVANIGKWAFYGCRALKNATISNSVNSIGDFAFYYCPSLESVLIGNSVTYIGSQAFDTYSEFTDVSFQGSEEEWEHIYIESNNDMLFSTIHYLGDTNHPESGACGENLIWRYDPENLSLTISGTGPMLDYSNEQYDVFVSTAPWRFFREKIQSLVIENGVSSIGRFAFTGCLNLTDLTVPDGLSRIGGFAFASTGFYYTDSNWENEALYLGKYLIEFGSQGSFTVREGTCLIADGASRFGSVITDIFIPDSVTHIGYSAFGWCSNLKSVTIPDGVTCIEAYTFHDCCSLANITISAGVTSIGEYAFYGCTGLTSITIPANVEHIDGNVFKSCTGLTEIHVDDQNPVYHSKGNCLIKTESKELIAGCKTSVIPDDDSVTSIGEGAFFNCTGLTDITIPDSVTSIGEYAFYGCTALTSVTIPKGVTEIEFETFDSCSSLTTITLPESVTRIAPHAMSNCDALTDIYYQGTEYRWSRVSISQPNNCLLNATIHYLGPDHPEEPAGIEMLTYEVTENGVIITGCDPAVAGALNIPAAIDGVPVTGIGKEAFAACPELTSVTIPNSVTSIGDAAFASCIGLTSVTIPGSVTSFGVAVFFNCIGLSSATIENGVTSIGEGAFLSCTGLTSVTIPNSVTNIGDQAFVLCTGLTSITIPNSVTSIGDQAFVGCSGLTSITIPNSVTSIGDAAFGGCPGLSSIVVAKENPVYHSAENCLIETETKTLLQGCKTSVIPNNGSVTSIGATAFASCTELTEITIPGSVTSIGKSAFFNTALTDVYFQGTQAAWDAIVIDEGNDPLLNATLHLTEAPKAPTIAIKNYTPTKSVAYKSTVTFTAVTENAPAGATVHWFLFSNDQGPGETFTMKEATYEYTVQAKLIGSDGTVLAESEVETVKVNTGFFARLVAFFRNLFGSLPVIVQATKETL